MSWRSFRFAQLRFAALNELCSFRFTQLRFAALNKLCSFRFTQLRFAALNKLCSSRFARSLRSIRFAHPATRNYLSVVLAAPNFRS